MSFSEGKMSAFEEKWVTLYHAAMLELEHGKMSSRIESARSEIAARVEKLRTMPGLHTDERHAIADALSALRALELKSRGMARTIGEWCWITHRQRRALRQQS
jgi:hypothetical protein